MQQGHFELPLKPEKGAGRQETVRSLEENEQTPLDYVKLAKQFYQAVKQRNAIQAKETLKQVQAGRQHEKRTLYLPEAHFQNQLVYLLYQRAKDRSFSFEVIKKRLADEINRNISEDNTLSLSEKSTRQEFMDSALIKMMRGVESVIKAVQNRENIKSSSDEYFIGTSDILDATKKIDLVEYSRIGSETTISFLQIKTGTITSEESEAVKTAHQEYLDSFASAIEDIVHHAYDQEFQTLLEKKDEPFTEQELSVLQAKWSVICMAAAETGEQTRSVQELQEYIAKNIIGYSDHVSVDDILFFKEIVTSPVLSEQVTQLLDKEFLPEQGRGALIEYMQALEEDLEQVLETYVHKNNTASLKNATFYSIIATPTGTQKEVILENKLQSPRNIDKNKIYDNLIKE